jgi:FkbM family methyltransferase
MPTENFINSNVVIGNILNDNREIRLDTFIDPTREDYKEFKNFVELTKNQKCLYDVGCADGIFSFAFCSDDTKVSHAFDASHQLQLSITETIVKNPTKKIMYHKMFLGNEDTIKSYDSSKLQSYAVSGNDTVVMITMDSFCSLTNVIPDTIKIDTEGYEYNVLMGGKELILSHRPLMFIELHPIFMSMYGIHISQIFDLQKKFNYSIKDISGKEITFEDVSCNYQTKKTQQVTADDVVESMQKRIYDFPTSKNSIRTVWYPK